MICDSEIKSREAVSSPQNKGRKNQEEAASPCTDSEKSSDEQDGSPQDTTRTPLFEDRHQHGLMLAAYRDVGNECGLSG